jgi:tripartite-type tricarboxylate transporter receptor subunit TctC
VEKKLRSLIAALALFPALALAQAAFAQTFPTKPVRIVLPFGPGGVADITTRTIAPKLSEGLGQQVIVENMPGAGGIRASETVARAEPDGHTLLLLTNGNAVSQALFKSLPYDPMNDFAMISTVGYFSMVIVTGANSQAKTLQELIALAKASPGKLNIGTITPGGTQHLAGELFRSTAGIDAVVVPYKTTGEVIVAARNGNVDAAVDFIAPLLASIRSGALRPLAVTAGKRFPGLPEVPTVIEAGVRGYDVASWNALAAPAKTPRAVVERVREELIKALAAPDVQNRFAELGVEPRPSTPAELRDFFIAESKRWTAVVERAKIPKQ